MHKILLLTGLSFALLTGCVSNPMHKPTQEQIRQYDNKLLAEVAENLINDFPNLSRKYSRKQVHALVRQNFKLAKKHKMVLTGSIYVLTGYQLFFGKPIDKLDKQGIITQILNSDDKELVKMAYINQRIEYLEEQNIITADEKLLSQTSR